MTRESGTEVPYRRLLQKTSDPLFVVDGDDRFDVVNQAFLDLVGYDRARLLDMEMPRLLAEDDADEWPHRRSLLRTEREADTWVARVVTKTGTEAPVELDCEVAAPDDSIVGVARDLRQQDRAEQKLAVLNRALRHNIRNRMNIVLGKATTLQGVDDEGYRTAAERIEAVGSEIINISNKARKAQKYLGIPPDEDCVADLVGVTEQVVTKFGISHPEATVRPDLPDRAMARAPPSYEVALMELVENGVVHHSSGNGPVSVTVEDGADRVFVHVRDECPPVPDAVVDCLDVGTEEPLKHNDGIGLWLVQWAVDTVGGDLSFDRREDGAGNKVTLTFDAIEE
jgi:PAS domain S-box-containing protein